MLQSALNRDHISRVSYESNTLKGQRLTEDLCNLFSGSFKERRTMRPRRRYTRFAVAVTLVAAAAVSFAVRGQTVQLRPGKYETTMERSAMGHHLPPVKNVDCITAEDVKNLKDFATNLAGADDDCAISNYEESSNRVTFTAVCDDDDGRTTVNAELTMSTDSFRFVVDAKDDEGVESRLTISTRRLGACDR
jgi:hypothetical protein